MNKDIFQEWLDKKEKSNWVKIALTDNSYKNRFLRETRKKYGGEVNTNLALLGDTIIKMCIVETLYDEKADELTEKKAKIESDKNLVTKIGKNYAIIEYIDFDENDKNIPRDYNYDDTPGDNRNRHKYIATAVEAMIGAIYKEERDIEIVKEIISNWILL